MRRRNWLLTFMAGIEVCSIRLWPRIWPLKWGTRLPNRVVARLTGMGLLKPIWFEFQPGLWMRLDIREMNQETILEERIWEPLTTQYVRAALRPGNVFLDIGANAGYFTLVAGQCVGSTGRVLAVEPNPAMARQAQLNSAQSGLRNVEVEQVACSDSPRTRRLYLGRPFFKAQTSLAERNVSWDECINVECVQADQLLRKHVLSRIDLVKIDVEGAEHEVLRGMNVILSNFRPRIIMELLEDKLRSFSTTADSVREYLMKFEYTVKPLGEHSNYLCLPNERLRS